MIDFVNESARRSGRLLVEQVEHGSVTGEIELGKRRAGRVANLGQSRIEQCDQPLKGIWATASAKLPNGRGLDTGVRVVQGGQHELVGACAFELRKRLATRSPRLGEPVVQQKR